MIALVTDPLRSLTRLVSRPLAPLSLLVLLSLLGLLAAVPVVESVAPHLERAVGPVWGPTGVDQPLLEDLPWYRGDWRRETGALWGVVGIMALVLFALGDAVLIRAATRDFESTTAAWGEAVRRAPALLTVALCALAWLVLDHLAFQRLLGRGLAAYAGKVDSEAFALWLQALPDLCWLIFALPAIVGADLARVRLITGQKRSGLFAFLWGVSRALRSITPWLLAGVVFVAESLVLVAFALTRHLWDPRVAATPLIAAGAILLLLLARLLAQGAYLGALARWYARVLAPGQPS